MVFGTPHNKWFNNFTFPLEPQNKNRLVMSRSGGVFDKYGGNTGPVVSELRLLPQYEDEASTILPITANTSRDEEIRIIRESLETLLLNSDIMFQVLMGSLIILMQAGFGFLEAGSVRAKNTTNILIKNYADLCFGKYFYKFPYSINYCRDVARSENLGGEL